MMQRALVFALIFDLSVGAYGTECGPGYKHKASLVGLTCATQLKDPASCNSGCCEKDKTTCGGLDGISCAWDQYAAGDDAWKIKAATEKTKNTDCCTPKVTCSNPAIITPAGKKSIGASVGTQKCASDANSCTQGSVCFTKDTTKCGGNTVACGSATKFVTGSDDAWKNTQITTNFAGDCCKVAIVCATATVTCPAGQKIKTGTNNCKNKDNSANSADAKDCQNKHTIANCCEADTTKCGGHTTSLCSAGFTASGTNDAWKNKVSTKVGTTLTDATQRNKDCCAKKATCASAVCTYVGAKSAKKKPNTDALTCTGDAKSCGTDANCCIVDTGKCGGLVGISCAYGFVDERNQWTKDTPQTTKDAWNNKPATDKTKNTACCTPVAVCALPVIGTTTPAPVVTTTPAAPALKFSQHKVAIEKSSDRPWGANMVWLGVGGLIGMSVLMAVQGLRSRIKTVARAPLGHEVHTLLEDSSLE